MKPSWWLPWLVRWRAWRASRFGTRSIALRLTTERRQMFIAEERHR
jgi:hypothetical protein